MDNHTQSPRVVKVLQTVSPHLDHVPTSLRLISQPQSSPPRCRVQSEGRMQPAQLTSPKDPVSTHLTDPIEPSCVRTFEPTADPLPFDAKFLP